MPLSLRPVLHLLSCWLPLTAISAKPQDPKKVAEGGERGPKLTLSAWVLNHMLVTHRFLWGLCLQEACLEYCSGNYAKAANQQRAKRDPWEEMTFFTVYKPQHTRAVEHVLVSLAHTTAAWGWTAIPRNLRGWKKSTGVMALLGRSICVLHLDRCELPKVSARCLDAAPISVPSSGTPSLSWGESSPHPTKRKKSVQQCLQRNCLILNKSILS